MGLETGTYIDSLVATNPVGATDPKSQGDDHLRLIKSTILATLPNLTGAMTLTHTQLNDAARKADANDFLAANTFDGNVEIKGGNTFKLGDSTNTDDMSIDHDGTDVNIRFTTTTDLNIDIASALTGQIKIFAPVHIVSGSELQIRDATNSDTVTISHDGTDLDLVFVNTGAMKIRDGVELRVYDSTDADYIGIKHDGTDAVWTATNVAEMDFASISIKSDNDDAAEPGYKGAPLNTQNGNYTLVLTDAAKTIYKASGGAGETITIPANASVAFPIGTIVVIINDGGGDLSVAITTDTLEAFGGATGTQTLTDNNKAVIEKVTATLWKYSATG